MSAKEMFQELGYEKEIKDNNICYVKNNHGEKHIIEFDENGEMSAIFIYNGYLGKITEGAKKLTKTELEAIMQQYHELAM